MKNVFKKNQVIITALAIMIAVAGYLNYSGAKFGIDKGEQASSDKVSNDSLDISDEDLYAQTSGDIKSNDVDLTTNTSEDKKEDTKAKETTAGEEENKDKKAEETAAKTSDTPGEAVFTGSSQVVSKAKINREQVRAKNKETLLEIINNEKLSDAQKKDAVDSMIELTDIAEKEAAAETLLAAKGFDDAVVSVSKGKADVVVNMADVTDAKRAQIEDIVKRKTGVSGENIVITPISGK